MYADIFLPILRSRHNSASDARERAIASTGCHGRHGRLITASWALECGYDDVDLRSGWPTRERRGRARWRVARPPDNRSL
jgi:hypothetical protein